MRALKNMANKAKADIEFPVGAVVNQAYQPFSNYMKAFDYNITQPQSTAKVDEKNGTHMDSRIIKGDRKTDWWLGQKKTKTRHIDR